jgi:ABC-type sugar transport system permease subunit
VLGLGLALALNQAYRGRGLVRAAVLVPWAVPTVVAGLLWRFMFDGRGIVNAVLLDLGVLQTPVVWFIHEVTAWVPVILADVWKTTPFVALLPRRRTSTRRSTRRPGSTGRRAGANSAT